MGKTNPGGVVELAENRYEMRPWAIQATLNDRSPDFAALFKDGGPITAPTMPETAEIGLDLTDRTAGKSHLPRIILASVISILAPSTVAAQEAGPVSPDSAIVIPTTRSAAAARIRIAANADTPIIVEGTEIKPESRKIQANADTPIKVASENISLTDKPSETPVRITGRANGRTPITAQNKITRPATSITTINTAISYADSAGQTHHITRSVESAPIDTNVAAPSSPEAPNQTPPAPEIAAAPEVPIVVPETDRSTPIEIQAARRLIEKGGEGANCALVIQLLMEEDSTLTAKDAAAFAGNFDVESVGCNPTQEQFGGGPGRNWAQWGSPYEEFDRYGYSGTPGNRKYGTLRWYADQLGMSEDDPRLQAKFVKWELDNTETRARDRIKNAGSVEEKAIEVGRAYERPKDQSDSAMAERARRAKRHYDALIAEVDIIRNEWVSADEAQKALDEQIARQAQEEIEQGEKQVAGYTLDQMPSFSQLSEEWGSVKYGDSNIANAGCAVVADAVASETLKKDGSNPRESAEWFEKNGGYVPDVGTKWLWLDADLFEERNLKIVDLGKSVDRIRESIEAGNLVLMSQTTDSIFTDPESDNGHILLIRGLTADGRFLIYNPNHKTGGNQNNTPFTAEQIAAELRGAFEYSVLVTAPTPEPAPAPAPEAPAPAPEQDTLSPERQKVHDTIKWIVTTPEGESKVRTVCDSVNTIPGKKDCESFCGGAAARVAGYASSGAGSAIEQFYKVRYNGGIKTDMSQLQEGDIVFYAKSGANGGYGHVGIAYKTVSGEVKLASNNTANGGGYDLFDLDYFGTIIGYAAPEDAYAGVDRKDHFPNIN